MDFKSPAARLAVKPALATCPAHDIAWHPLQTRIKPLTEARPNETKGEKHVRVREINRRRMHARYAAVQGVTLQFPDPAGETGLALAALMYAGTGALGFVQQAFDAYWVHQQDLDDPQVVNQLLVGAGLDPDGFDPDRWRSALNRHQSDAEQAGLIDAPAFVIADQLFIGREHLPWIAELLNA